MQNNLAARAGRWSARNRRKAILGWFAFVLLAVFAGGAAGMSTLSDTDMQNGDSKRANQAIDAADFPEYASEQVLVQGRGSVRADDPRFRAAVRDVTERLFAVRSVRDIESPLVRGNDDKTSRDGRSALITFKVLGDDEEVIDRVEDSLAATAAAQQANPQVRVEQFGDASTDKAFEEMMADDFSKAERTSLPVTLAILLFAFGSLVAAGVPLLLGITAVAATLGLLSPISRLVPVDEMVSSIVLLIGLAVGVDYSMFYLRRKLQERAAGRSNEAALEVAARTSGHAVLVSGLTVIVAMAGMFFAGNAVFTSFAVGCITVVAIAVIGSLTVLPATLAWLGDRVERGRAPLIGRRRSRGDDSRVWGWILDRVLGRPVAALSIGAALLIALAIPALDLKTIDPGVAGAPRDMPVMQTYDRIQAAFPGGPIPAVVVVRAKDVTTRAVERKIADLEIRALASGRFSGPMTSTTSPDRTVEIVNVPMAGNGTDAVSEAALTRLRDEIIPATLGTVPGTDTRVTGLTAESKDFGDTMNARLPFVMAFVLGLAFVLLLCTFRSLVIPLTAIALNLLSVGAAYGAVKLVFQDGYLSGLLDFEQQGGVITWLPLFLFVILFGLSMDYHVFILTRVREGVDAGLSTEEAVSRAIRRTAGVVTSAAVVMIAVFSIFATLSAIYFKEFGVALALAVLIDATIVRAVLLPSTMKLLGEWNWYLPRYRGPRLHGWYVRRETSVRPPRTRTRITSRTVSRR